MSEKHFEFTGETKVWLGITLNRIRATKDLPKFGVKNGGLGGWVEKESQIYGDAHVDSPSAILWITLASFYTVTVTRKLIFCGCKTIKRSELKSITEEKAVEMGMPRELYPHYMKMVRAAMKVVKRKP